MPQNVSWWYGNKEFNLVGCIIGETMIWFIYTKHYIVSTCRIS